MKIPLLLLLTSLCAFSEVRTWTRAEDQNSFRGEYISQDIEAESVTISKSGKEFSLPLSTFIKEDLAYVAKMAAAEEEQRKLTGPIGEAVLERHAHPKATVETYYSYLPASYTKAGEKSPVCFIYSPGGDSRRILDPMQKTADELGWVLIGIDSYKNDTAKSPAGGEQIIEDAILITETAFEDFNIDEERVVFAGYSGGAWWSYRSSHAVYKDTRGILAFGGWMNREYDSPYPRKMAVAMVNGDNDSNARAWEKKDGEALEDRRAKVKVFTFSGGHQVPPKDTILEAAKWVHETQEF